MRSAETIAIAYFAVLGAAAWMRERPLGRRLTISAIAVVMSAAIVWLARAGAAWRRDWAPVIVILVGYYISGQCFHRPSAAFESWLAAWDRRLLGDPARAFASWPGWLLDACELAYMGTFVLIPLGCAILIVSGREAAVPRYWTLVVAAEFGSFAPLAFLQSRPPWALERVESAPGSVVRRCGLVWVRSMSHCANTFPSGHAAGSLAVALGVAAAMPAAGTVLLLVALMISVGCLAGRYHYVADVLSGIALTLAIWILV